MLNELITELKNLTNLEMGKYFENLEMVNFNELKGIWKGYEISTTHAMSGALSKINWEGKEFVSKDEVYPLVMKINNRFLKVNPRFLPINKMTIKLVNIKVLRLFIPYYYKLIKSNRPHATIESYDVNNINTCSIVYNDLQIIDVLKKIDQNMIIGQMNTPYFEEKYYFLLIKK